MNTKQVTIDAGECTLSSISFDGTETIRAENSTMGESFVMVVSSSTNMGFSMKDLNHQNARVSISIEMVDENINSD